MGELCLLCNSCIMAVHDVSKVAENGLQRYRELADNWSRIDSSLPACSKASYAEFLTDAQWLSAVNHDIAIHNSCCMNFQRRLKCFEGQCNKPSNPQICKVQTLKFWIRKLAPDHNRVRRGSMPHNKVCFICNTVTPNDENAYNEGGIGRCSEDNASLSLKHAMETAMNDEGHKHHAAAKRLKVILEGTHTHTQHTHNRFTALWNLSGKTRVSRYQKNIHPLLSS